MSQKPWHGMVHRQFKWSNQFVYVTATGLESRTTKFVNEHSLAKPYMARQEHSQFVYVI